MQTGTIEEEINIFIKYQSIFYEKAGLFGPIQHQPNGDNKTYLFNMFNAPLHNILLPNRQAYRQRLGCLVQTTSTYNAY